MCICICSCVCSAVCSCNSFDRRQCDRPHEERHRILDGNTLAKLKQQNRNTQRSQVAQKNMSCGSSPSCAFANYARVTQTSSFVIIVLRYLSKIHAHKHTHTQSIYTVHIFPVPSHYIQQKFSQSRIELICAWHFTFEIQLLVHLTNGFDTLLAENVRQKRRKKKNSVNKFLFSISLPCA